MGLCVLVVYIRFSVTLFSARLTCTLCSARLTGTLCSARLTSINNKKSGECLQL